MVEFILVSVAVVAVILLFINMRSLRGGDPELPMLDGNPRWVSGVVTTIKRTGDYLGMPTASLELKLGDTDCELSGPLPPSFADAIAPGLVVEGHIEYDLLDTVRTDLWDASPETVLNETARRLETTAVPTSEEPRTLTVEREGRSIEICLADDGWLMVTYGLPERQDVSVDLRADFDVTENAHMLTSRLGIMPDHAEHADALSRLSPTTLEALERFVTKVEGWVCIDHEELDFECALPFPHADIIVELIEELVPVMAAVERELAGPADAGDGAW